MAASKADVINIDLEDSVAPSDKVSARKNAISAINEINWGNKTLSVRINGLDTSYWYRDVVDLVEKTDGRLDQIMIPKAGNAKDIYAVDALVSSIESSRGITKGLNFEAIIETAAGLVNVNEIASSSSRLKALSLGAADFAASMGMQTTGIGGTQSNYYMIENGEVDSERNIHFSDPWHSVTTSIVAACRTYGLLPVDGPFGDFNDPDAYIAAAKRGAAIGIEGKWAIHPSQIKLANKVFSPPETEVNKAKRILEELDKAAKEGKGAAQLDGRMIDAASARMAENIVNIDKLIHNK